MVIKASSGKEINTLILDLGSDRATTRDAAVARLTVIGGRAVERLLTLASDDNAVPAARAGAFRALEGIGDPKAFDAAIASLSNPDAGVTVAAVNLVRSFLNTPRGVTALDRLMAIALDRLRSSPVRVAAIQSLSDLGPSTLNPLIAALENDPDPAVASALEPGPWSAAVVVDSVQRLREAADGTLRDDAEALRQAIAHSSREVPPAVLHQIIERIRVQEGSAQASQRANWMTARAAAHLALAQRGSRLALYDLRETIESARQPLAVEFLAAVTEIGDASCLEPIAAAHAKAAGDRRAREDWWPRHLADAFRAIAARERMTRRHAVAKKIDKRWPGLFASLTSPKPEAWTLEPGE